jgi:prepilin-type processing-associated H-X9-DG protein
MSRLPRTTGRSRPARRGLSAIELLVVLVIAVCFVLCVLMILPRQRETARMASCQRNLMQIGVALALFDQNQRSLPQVPPLPLGAAPAEQGDSPLKALLAELGLPDLTELEPASSKAPRPKRSNSSHAKPEPESERRVPSFICPSDPHATAGLFPAPVSYRACTGDTPDGQGGAFAPGRHLSIADIEAADGASYTAAFAERLVGDNQSEHPAPFNYALAPGPLAGTRCPDLPDSAWRGDAGRSWTASNWQSTLYNHALTPNAAPSCIAADRRSACMGASSGHAGGASVLFFDGSTRTFTPTIEPKVWREWATVPETAGTKRDAPSN